MASAPAELPIGPSAGRKKAIGEKNKSSPTAAPTGARPMSPTPRISTAYLAPACPAATTARIRVRRRSQAVARAPMARVEAVASASSGGTGSTLKRRRGPAVVGSE